MLSKKKINHKETGELDLKMKKKFHCEGLSKGPFETKTKGFFLFRLSLVPLPFSV